VKPAGGNLQRTELRRTGGLARTSGLTRTASLPRTPWKPEVPYLAAGPAGAERADGRSAAKTKRDTGFSRKTKLKVRTRAGNGDPDMALCECCGIWLGRRHGQVQHRVGRGSGGCTDAVINGLANAALLCGTPHSGCHGKATAFDRDLAAEAKGFWIKRGTTAEHDPRCVPIMLASGRGSGVRVWLSEDGGYLFKAPEAAA
jgi:hypothetical protein